VYEHGRIAGLDGEKRSGADFERRFELGLGLVAWVDLDGLTSSAAPREIGEGSKSALCAAAVVYELAKRDRPDILRAYQAQAGHALGVPQLGDGEWCSLPTR
jgi:hypothetical protein